MPDLMFLQEAVGTSRRGGPPGTPLVPGLDALTLAQQFRSAQLSSLAEWHIREERHYKSFARKLTLLIMPRDEVEVIGRVVWKGGRV